MLTLRWVKKVPGYDHHRGHLLCEKGMKTKEEEKLEQEVGVYEQLNTMKLEAWGLSLSSLRGGHHRNSLLVANL